MTGIVRKIDQKGEKGAAEPHPFPHTPSRTRRVILNEARVKDLAALLVQRRIRAYKTTNRSQAELDEVN